MNIKVCGITQLKQLQQLEAMDIDFAGLVFHKNSPRYAGDSIPKKDLKALDLDIKKVGIFLNPKFDEVMKFVDDFALDVVQLHGSEVTPYLCEELSEETEVIKAFSLDADADIDAMIEDYDEVCDYYLFNTSLGTDEIPSVERYDWKQFAKSKIEKPFLISGSIGIDDIAAIKAIKHPDFYGVDINSMFEKEPGVKDMGLILQFKLGMKKK